MDIHSIYECGAQRTRQRPERRPLHVAQRFARVNMTNVRNSHDITNKKIHVKCERNLKTPGSLAVAATRARKQTTRPSYAHQTPYREWWDETTTLLHLLFHHPGRRTATRSPRQRYTLGAICDFHTENTLKVYNSLLLPPRSTRPVLPKLFDLKSRCLQEKMLVVCMCFKSTVPRRAVPSSRRISMHSMRLRRMLCSATYIHLYGCRWATTVPKRAAHLKYIYMFNICIQCVPVGLLGRPPAVPFVVFCTPHAARSAQRIYKVWAKRRTPWAQCGSKSRRRALWFAMRGLRQSKFGVLHNKPGNYMVYCVARRSK